ncbi:MAG: hypothetical protein V3T84_16630 [Phycisphaerales bacterium]
MFRNLPGAGAGRGVQTRIGAGMAVFSEAMTIVGEEKLPMTSPFEGIHAVFDIDFRYDCRRSAIWTRRLHLGFSQSAQFAPVGHKLAAETRTDMEMMDVINSVVSFIAGVIATIAAKPLIGKIRMSKKSNRVDQSGAKAGRDIIGRDKHS